VGNGFDGHDAVALGALALVVALDRRVEAHREVGRLDVGPGQILVAVLGVAPTLAFAVGQSLAAHTTAVRAIVADPGKALHRSDLEHDDQAQNLADPADGEQVAIGWAQLHLSTGLALQQVDGRLLSAYGQQCARRIPGTVHLSLLPASRREKRITYTVPGTP
jgi:hypothetical protein